MQYLRILSAFAGQPWAMQPEKLEAISAFLMFKARGGTLSQDEVQARISDRRAEQTVKSPGGIAVLPVSGVISQRMGMMLDISGGTSTDALSQQFDAALADDTVKAIIFAHDSPGGGTYGVDELATKIRDARGIKPIVAQVDIRLHALRRGDRRGADVHRILLGRPLGCGGGLPGRRAGSQAAQCPHRRR